MDKFADWDTHATDPAKLQKPVTPEEKILRAEEIATMLSDNKRWHSHGRKIGLDSLIGALRLKIDDYSNDEQLRLMIREYHDFLIEYIQRKVTRYSSIAKTNFEGGESYAFGQ